VWSPGHERRWPSMSRHHRTRGIGIVELAPKRCPNGHPLGAQQVLVGSQPCLCAGIPHRTWQCVTCAAVLVWPACEIHPQWTVWSGEP
jgi:hypothetical protein